MNRSLYLRIRRAIKRLHLQRQSTFTNYIQNFVQHTAAIGDHQCGFRRNRPATDEIFCIRQVLENKWEYSEAVHHLFVDFKKAYDSVRWEVLYNILIQFGIPMKLVRIIKMCLNETQSSVHVGKHMSDMLSIKNGLKQGDAVLTLLFNFTLEYAIRGFR